MDNRRLDYRHAFDASDRFAIALRSGAGAFEGEIIDLSLSGMSVLLKRPAGELKPNQRVHAELKLGAAGPMPLSAVVVHGRRTPEPCYGLRFLPLAETHATDARERQLMRYLFDEQRRRRQL
jgi:c-di-GMP-binding flagellar brake protein YcgR